MLRLTSHKYGLALFYLHHFATFVMAAFEANAVWQAGLTTIRAQVSLGGAQGIVRATFVSTSFGMSSLRIWHNYSIKKLPIVDCRLPIGSCNYGFQLAIGN
jgi:hypothetical protein